MARKTIKDYERELSPLQVQIANELVQNDYSKHSEKLTITQIAEKLGISRTSLYNHKNNGAVIAYMALLSERQLDQFRSKADNALQRLIFDGSDRLPSVKALQLYYQLLGRLVERKVVTDNEETLQPRISQAELDLELQKLSDLL
jgi:AcrR family transcriptional regulator